MIAVEKGDGTIEIKFPYNTTYIEKIKAIDGRKWHPEEKCWSVLYSKGAIEKILNAFDGEEVTLDPVLQEELFKQHFGDKYSKGEWIPLGFYCMQEVLKRGYLLKSIIVKNFEETRAKRNQKELWRYRSLVGGFYIFKGGRLCLPN